MENKHGRPPPPDLNPFWNEVLSWDFYKDIVDDQKLTKEMKEVPLHFSTYQDYMDCMLPLFFEEVKMQIHRCKFSDMKSVAELVSINDFGFKDGFVKITVHRNCDESKMENFGQFDLILFTRSSNTMEECPVHTLALVDQNFKSVCTIRAKLDQAAAQGSRSMAMAKAVSGNEPGWYMAKVTGLSTVIREYEGLVSLPHTHLREIVLNRDEGEAMATLPQGENSAGTGTAADPTLQKGQGIVYLNIPAPLEKFLKSKYNESQFKAINDSRKAAGITLVQGPPGTGKTTTILGILAVLLNARAKASRVVSATRRDRVNTAGSDMETSDEEPDEVIEKRRLERIQALRGRIPWFQQNYVAWNDGVEQELSGTGGAKTKIPYPKVGQAGITPMSEIVDDVAPHRILVCAPSNAAIDEVMRRVINDGVADSDGVSRKISLIRMGPGSHKELQEHNLEMIVRKKLESQSEMPDMSQRENEKIKLIRDARCVCSTLSVSGSRDLVGYPGDFDTVVVDEASQGVELSMLVPMKLGCRRLILVGDPQQLPATCFSAIAMAHGYDRSLFQRLQMSQFKVNMLETQYRMHPAISSFPSARFYNGALYNMWEKLQYEQQNPAPWSQVNSFGAVTFFHLQTEHEKSAQSLVNPEEADFVLQLFTSISELYPKEQWRTKIAVISPYAEQVQLLRLKFRALFQLPPKSPCPVDVNTVDGFQGREKDCIIVSVVRAASGDSKHKTIGFVRDRRRMNVAFTRARTNLWVVGHAEVLSINEDWKAFINEQEKESRLLRVSKPYDTFFRRYLTGWYDRHSDVARPDCRVCKPFSEVELAAIAAEQAASAGVAEYKLTADEIEQMKKEEEERERQLHDVEVASVDSEDEPLGSLNAAQDTPSAGADVPMATDTAENHADERVAENPRAGGGGGDDYAMGDGNVEDGS